MAKISIEDVKKRLMKASDIDNDNNHIDEEEMITESASPENSDEIEFVEAVNDNLVIFKRNDSFILSPIDDTLDPIIGEFDEIPEDGSMPPCMKDWLDTYSKEVNYFQENEEELMAEYSEETMADGDTYGSIELVDLGLSVKWANMNIGAAYPEDPGNYYAWAETDTKTTYTIAKYKYYDATSKAYTLKDKNISKNVDYDAAFKFDNELCLPTKEQYEELISKCTLTKTQLNGKSVLEVKGPNGNKIYFPIGGCYAESSTLGYKNYGYCWSSAANSNMAQAEAFKITDKPALFTMYKRTGANVRAVESKIKVKPNDIKFVDLGLSVNWAETNLGALKAEEYGDYYAWGELEPKDIYSWDTYKYYVKTPISYGNLGSTITQNSLYDAAYVKNNNMFIPKAAQWEELIKNCTWTEKIQNGVKGFEIKGPNGNTIFLPNAGYKLETDSKYVGEQGCYTTACVYSSNTDQYRKTCNFKTCGQPSITYTRRRAGTPIRPISNKVNNNDKDDGNSNKKKTIQPLVPFKWGQSAPYYNQLPLDPATGKRVVTGCTQTALALILAYYAIIGVNGKKFRRGMANTDAYISKKGTKSELSIPELPAIAMFDWDNMNYVKSGDFKTTEAKNAVAELMKYLGYANKAYYSSNGTGASPTNAVNTAKSKMHFGEGAKLIYASSGVDSFKEQIYKELEAGYPVHCSGWSKDGSSAHSFVCDGYDAQTGKYHFNWGWNGSYDGWFDIAILKPSSSNDFSYSKRCIIGLHPDYLFGDLNTDNEVTVSDIMNLVQAIVDKKVYDYKNDINSDGKVDENDIMALINYMMGNKI